MQLTRHTDFAFRLLIYLTGIGERRATIAEVAHAQGIPCSHLMKIANDLAKCGFIEATRGRGGGIRLGRDPHDIRMGDVIEAMEPQRGMVDCTGCRLLRQCGLPQHLERAGAAFHAILNEQTLADIAGNAIAGDEIAADQSPRPATAS